LAHPTPLPAFPTFLISQLVSKTQKGLRTTTICDREAVQKKLHCDGTNYSEDED